MLESVGHTKFLSWRVDILAKKVLFKTKMTHIMWVSFLLHRIDDFRSPRVFFKLCVMEWFHATQLEENSTAAAVIPGFKNSCITRNFLFFLCEFIQEIGGVQFPKIQTSKADFFYPLSHQKWNGNLVWRYGRYWWSYYAYVQLDLFRDRVCYGVVRNRDSQRMYHLWLSPGCHQQCGWKHAGNHRKSSRFLFDSFVDARLVCQAGLSKRTTEW